MKDTKKPAAQTPFRRYGKNQKPLGAFKLNINPGIASDAVYAMMAQDTSSELADFLRDPSLLPKRPPGKP